MAINLTAADETQDRALAILRDHCLACHSKPTIMSGLDLSTRESALKGGQRGPALVPGRAGDSRLYQAVRRTTPLAMPPTKPLAEADIEALRQWIEAGAHLGSANGQFCTSLDMVGFPETRPSRSAKIWPGLVAQCHR